MRAAARLGSSWLRLQHYNRIAYKAAVGVRGSMCLSTIIAIAEEKTKRIQSGLVEGKRACLAEAITLVESRHPGKQEQAQWLLTSLLSQRSKLASDNRLNDTFRIGLSGPPGAGKSTLIEALGTMLIQKDHRIAVLAVDPSSSRHGGSILADKTRMPKLANNMSAFVRPSPSGGTLGGVARNTQEAILLCEGAGFNTVIVETVGVGQSEIAVAGMVDMFVLLVPPAAGDDLQGMKKGIVELADLVVVTKADGDLIPAANRIQSDYLSALRLVRRGSGKKSWRPKVLRVSSLLNEGFDELWSVMGEFVQHAKETGEFTKRRRLQQKSWMWSNIEWQLMQRFKTNPRVMTRLSEVESRVVEGSLTPGTAADWLLEQFTNQTT